MAITKRNEVGQLIYIYIYITGSIVFQSIAINPKVNWKY